MDRGDNGTEVGVGLGQVGNGGCVRGVCCWRGNVVDVG